MLEKSLVGARVGGLFNGTSYSGIITESIAEADGHYNHIIRLDHPIVRQYDNPYQTDDNNRWVLKHINFHTAKKTEDNFMMRLADRY